MSAATAGRPSAGPNWDFDPLQQHMEGEFSDVSSILGHHHGGNTFKGPNDTQDTNKDRGAKENVPVTTTGQKKARPRYSGDDRPSVNIASVSAGSPAQIKGPREMPPPSYASAGRSAKDRGSHDWASDRSPLQKLEVTLGGASKEDKRSRAQDAEARLKERLARQKANSNYRDPKSRGISSRQLPAKESSRELPLSDQPPDPRGLPVYDTQSRKEPRKRAVRSKPDVGYAGVNNSPTIQPQSPPAIRMMAAPPAPPLAAPFPPTPAEIMAKIPRQPPGTSGQLPVPGMNHGGPSGPSARSMPPVSGVDTAWNGGGSDMKPMPRPRPGNLKQPPLTSVDRQRDPPDMRYAQDMRRSMELPLGDRQRRPPDMRRAQDARRSKELPPVYRQRGPPDMRRAEGARRSREVPPSDRQRGPPDMRRAEDARLSKELPPPPPPMQRDLGPEVKPFPGPGGISQQRPQQPQPLQQATPPSQMRPKAEMDPPKPTSRGIESKPLPVMNVSSMNVAERDFAAMPTSPAAPTARGLFRGVPDKREAQPGPYGQTFRTKPKKQNVNVSFDIPPATPPPLYEWKNAPVAKLDNSNFEYKNIEVGGGKDWWNIAGTNPNKRDSMALPKNAYQTASQQTFCTSIPLAPLDSSLTDMCH